MNTYQVPSPFPEESTVEQRKNIILEIGKVSNEKFKEKYPILKNWFKDFDSLYILSMFNFYFLKLYEGIDLEAVGKQEFFPHHLEILQAFSLMQPRSFSHRPLMEEAEKLREEMLEIDELIKYRSWFLPPNLKKEEWESQIYLADVRNRTSAVRNWAYYHQMMKVSKDLMKIIGPQFQKVHGLNPDKIVTCLINLINKIQAKFSQHENNLRKFLNIKDPKEMIRSYYRVFMKIDVVEPTEIDRLLKRVDHDRMSLASFLMTHSDFDIPELLTFNISELCEAYGEGANQEFLKIIFDKWSLSFGELENHNPEHFILDNPVWDKPFIKLEDGKYFTSVLSTLPDRTLAMLENLISEDNKLKKRFFNVRAEYLENEVEMLLRKGFPNAKIFKGSKGFDPESGKNFENDFTIILDSFAIIIECKSGHMDSPAKRGGIERLKDTFKELIVEPSKQANRFIEFLKNNVKEHEFQTDKGVINKLDNRPVRYYLSLGVTFENLGHLSCNIESALKAGVVNEDINNIASSICFTDLECIFDLLPLEIEKIHYLIRRREFEKNVDYQADELSLLGFYLETGFNIGEDEFKEDFYINMTLKSKELDPYFVGTSEGRKIKKPFLAKTVWWEDILNRITEVKVENWVEAGFILLNASFEDQKKFEKEFIKLKKRVQKGKAKHKFDWINFVSGPKERSYLIVGFPYNPQEVGSRYDRNEWLSKLLGQDLDINFRGSVCIGIDAFENHRPYSAFAMDKENSLLNL